MSKKVPTILRKLEKCRLCLSLKAGKKIDKCCSEENNGKFYCKLTKETYDNCCLRRPVNVFPNSVKRVSNEGP
jgi:hypothetical protein